MQTGATHYREKAEQCRRLARDVTARDVAERLTLLAEEYDAEAEAAEAGPDESEDRA
jgi:hypothetical protein